MNSEWLSGNVIPFSFNIGERTARLQRISSRERHDNGRLITHVEFREEIKPLTVTLAIEEDRAASCCRVTPTLRAEKTITDRICGLSILELRLDDREREDHYLYGITGASLPELGANASFLSLKPWTRAVRVGDSVEIDSDRSGRSSNSQIPLWVYARGNGGYWFGPEWSGCWRARVDREGASTCLQVSLPSFDFTLEEGEQIELPAVSFGTYQGDLEQGLNAVRSTLLTSVLPKYDGRAPTPKVVFQGYAGLPDYQTEDVLYQEVDRAAQLGCEVFVLDAGWNQPPNSGNWFEWLGYWQPDAQRFPRGFDRFARYVHDKGMKLGLWIEPRAAVSSPAFVAHPDLYLLPSDASIAATVKFWTEQNYWKDQPKEPIVEAVNMLNENKGLLDLSREGGRALFLAQLEDLVSLGADWIWFDFNTDPRVTIWDLHEKPDRKGLLELEFYKGLYQVFDTFLERHPDVWIEACASGGRIIDLGMLRRSHSFWVYDTASDDNNRSVRGGVNTLFPAAIIQTGLFQSTQILAKQPAEPVALNGYHRLLTGFGGVLQFGQGLCFWRQEDLSEATRYVEKYKEFRSYLSKDFFNLLPMGTNAPSWEAWQYHNAVPDEGILLLFHINHADDKRKSILPKGVNGVEAYTWSTVLGSAVVTQGEQGIVVEMDAPAAALIHYHSTAPNGG